MGNDEGPLPMREGAFAECVYSVRVRRSVRM